METWNLMAMWAYGNRIFQDHSAPVWHSPSTAPSMEALGKYKMGKFWSQLGTMHNAPEKGLSKLMEGGL